MNRMIFFIFSLFVINACKNQVKETSVIATPIQPAEEGATIRQIPDKTFILEGVDNELLHKTIVRNLQVVDNHFQFGLAREEFVDLGLPEEYYDRLLKDMEDMNHMIDSTGLENVDRMLQESYKDLYELYGYPESSPSVK